MITESKIEQIIERVIEGVELTTKELNQMGFNSTEITKLIGDNIITRIKRGYYELSSYETIYTYYKKMLPLKQYEQANKCLRLCYSINPKNSNICSQLIISYLNLSDLDNAYDFCKRYYEISKKRDKLDSKLFLYLFNYIMDVPEEDKDLINNFSYKDVKLVSKDDDILRLDNQIREHVFKKDFNKALDALYQKREKNGSFYTNDVLTKLLLKKANDYKIEQNNKLNLLVKDEKYEEIISYLETLNSKYKLNGFEALLLKIVIQVKNIRDTNIIPKIHNVQVNSIHDAVHLNNYEKALSFCIEFNEQNNIENDKSIIYNILVNTLRLIENIEKEKKDEINSNYELIIFDIVNDLINNKVVTSLIKLEKYLYAIDKEKYYTFLSNVVKLCMLNNDSNYSELIQILTLIIKDEYKFNVTNYLMKYYDSLGKNELEYALVYLNIIKEGKELGDKCGFEYLLGKIFAYTKELYGNVETFKQIESNLNDDIKYTEVGVYSKSETNEIEEKELGEQSDDINSQKYTKSIVDNNAYEKEESIKESSIKSIILKKVEEIRDKKELILFKSMNDKKRSVYEQYLDEYEDISYFTIGSQSKRLVAYYAPNKNTYLDDYLDIVRNAKKLFYNEEYRKSIKEYKKVLEVGLVKTFIIAYIGLSYLKLGAIKLAIIYLEVATELSSLNGDDFDFTELLCRLKRTEYVENEDYKPKTEFSENEFSNDIDNYYGIDCIEEICALIRDGKDVKYACDFFQITGEKVTLVELILARECYIEGSFDIGDYYLTLAKQSNNKNKMIIDLISDITRNKKFYMHRDLSNHKQLSLLRTIK